MPTSRCGQDCVVNGVVLLSASVPSKYNSDAGLLCMALDCEDGICSLVALNLFTCAMPCVMKPLMDASRDALMYS